MRLAPEVTLAAGDMRSEILVGGAPTGAMVDGAWLEAAVRAGERTLLFVSDDVPYEEGLHVTLHDAAWTLLDRADFAWPYASGVFSDLELLDDRQLRFRCAGDGPVLLRLLALPVRRLWPGAGVRGWRRRFGAVRHFELTGG